MELIFKVEIAVQIEGRGCVIGATCDPDECIPFVENGDSVVLKTPEGIIFESSIVGVEMINYRCIPERIPMGLLLNEGVVKEDVPEGTEVYRK